MRFIELHLFHAKRMANAIVRSKWMTKINKKRIKCGVYGEWRTKDSQIFTYIFVRKRKAIIFFSCSMNDVSGELLRAFLSMLVCVCV